MVATESPEISHMNLRYCPFTAVLIFLRGLQFLGLNDGRIGLLDILLI